MRKRKGHGPGHVVQLCEAVFILGSQSVPAVHASSDLYRTRHVEPFDEEQPSLFFVSVELHHSLCTTLKVEQGRFGKQGGGASLSTEEKRKKKKKKKKKEKDRYSAVSLEIALSIKATTEWPCCRPCTSVTCASRRTPLHRSNSKTEMQELER